jgi:hypothetical protein
MLQFQPWSGHLSSQSSMLPDAMPLREALRGMRYVLRRGGKSIKNRVTVDKMPTSAAHLAGVVLREVEVIAKGVDQAASGFAKKMLSSPDPAAPSLHSITGQQNGDIVFAKAFYAATQAVLKRLCAPNLFISETRARKAFQKITVFDVPDAEIAASLTIGLHNAQVLKGKPAETARVPANSVMPVAVFAVMLWLQSQRPEAEDEAALDAATDLSVALASDVSKACNDGNHQNLAALYTEFASHV